MFKETRRDFISLLSGAALAPRLAFGEIEKGYGIDHPDMLVQHIAGKLNALAAKWDGERAKLTTPAAIQARNRFVREKTREMIHGFPDRSPLQPRVVRTLQRDGYRIENVMFQSRPDFWVTGNLYVPAGSGPFPGIISPCGHYQWARMEPEYQFAYQNLVRGGFVVLAFDPVGQGERRQYWNPATGETEYDFSSTYEHSMAGQLLLLMGEDLTHYRVWDGMRAIDYLLSRPEVDAKRIGCAGHSGGATLTRFISAVDERVQVAVINQGGTGHRWPIHAGGQGRMGPSDVEQNIFPAALYGVDLCDLDVSIAPRPLLATTEHFTERFHRAADHIRTRYQQLGVPERFAVEEAADPHSWTMKLRVATTAWFSRWFYDRPGPDREPPVQIEKAEDLYCTPNGSVRYSKTGETIHTLMQKKVAGLPPPRAACRTSADVQRMRREMAAEIQRAIRYKKPEGPLAVRRRYDTPRNGYRVEKLEFISEPGIYIPTWVFVPEKPVRTQAILYVSEAGKEADGLEFGRLEEFARKGRLSVAVDVRGIGETRPAYAPGSGATHEFRHLFDVETALSYNCWYMDESLFGMRVQDVVRSVDYVLSRQDVQPGGVSAIGRGMGALWVLYAAALDPRIQAAVCDGGLGSYRDLVASDRYVHGANVFVRDVLLKFDLPHVAAAIADRKLTLLSPVDEMRRSLAPDRAAEMYRFAADAYTAAGTPNHFQIVARAADVSSQYLTLIS